jgi:hypothetical protein
MSGFSTLKEMLRTLFPSIPDIVPHRYLTPRGRESLSGRQAAILGFAWHLEHDVLEFTI